MSAELILAVWLIGVGFLVAEAFVPGVVMGIIGVITILVSIITMFAIEDGGPLWGGALTLGSLIAGGLILKVGAARLTHRHVLDEDSGFVGTDDRSDLIGLEGVTATVLRPGGFATIGGRRVDVVTAGELLDRGVPVEVYAVEGYRVQVRAKAQKLSPGS